MTPTEEFVFMCIKNGYNTTKKLTKKTGKSEPYLHAYLSFLSNSGKIKTICPTCERKGYYTVVGG